MGEMADLINESGFDSEDMDAIHKEQERDLGNPYWEYFGQYEDGLTGKFLVFSEDRELLVKATMQEITHYFFKCGKVSKLPRNGSYVLCLYAKDDSRKYELRDRYKECAKLSYRWWKSNADTAAGKYSKQYTEGINHDRSHRTQ